MRTFKLAGISLMALSLGALANNAFAADAAATTAAASSADASELAAVIVTAEKRPENLQKTPIAISVLSGGDLDKRHISSLVDLGDGAIPSLRVAPFYSRNSALIINVRGIGVLSDSNQPARDQGVGVYLDGVYLGRAQGLGSAIYDVENIEVLKGPQGTLFGRNTEGGAVNIVTKKPSGKFKLSVTAGAGDYGSAKGEVHLDLPSYNDISVKLDALVTRRDGTVTNPSADDFNAFDRRGLHAQALWKPSEKFSADYSFDISRDATTSLYLQQLSLGSLPRAALATVEPTRVDHANVGVPEQYSVGNSDGHRLTMEYTVSPSLTVKSISSYRGLTQTQYDNGSANPTMISATGNFTGVKFSRYSLAYFKQDQYSEELQAIGSAERVNYVLGALYYHEHVRDNAQAFNTNQFLDAAGATSTILSLDYTAQRIDRASRVTTTSIGAFGQATYTPAMFGDRMHLTVGARLTRDKKVGQLYIVNGATPSVLGVTAPVNLNADWSRVDPLVNLGYDITDDVHGYLKYSTGYKSGGANSRSLFYAPFKPEIVKMTEAGLKSEFWDHRARFNIAAYTGDYKQVQLDFSAQYQQIINGVLLSTTRTTTETTNTTSPGSLSGVEADLAVNPMTGLTVSFSYAHNEVTIPNSLNPFPQANGAYITVPIPIYQVYTPKESGSVAVDYERRFGFARLQLHFDGNYDSGYYANYTDPGFNTATGAVTVKQPKGDKAFVTNGRIALTDIALPNGAVLTASVWSRNLLNEQHVFYKTFSPLVGGGGFFNEPRTVGAELNVKY